MGKVTISFVWAFIQKFGNTFLSFISNIILARLLLPEDYGAIGMIMIFIVISNTFIDGGFGSALIQKTIALVGSFMSGNATLLVDGLQFVVAVLLMVLGVMVAFSCLKKLFSRKAAA